MLKIDAVVKIGGSLIRNRKSLVEVCREINKLARRGYKIVIVAGGGELVDTIKRSCKKYSISDTMAHWMAIMAMDINAMFIADLEDNYKSVTSIKDCIRVIKSKHVPVLLVYKILRENDILPKSWNVTSDSISLYIAQICNSKFHILLKDVRGLYDYSNKKTRHIKEISAEELRKWEGKSCIDSYLPELLLRYNRETLVISGLYPERIKEILNSNKVCGTYITSH